MQPGVLQFFQITSVKGAAHRVKVRRKEDRAVEIKRCELRGAVLCILDDE